MASVYENLRQRGLIAQMTDENLPQLLAEKTFTMYTGFDPTGASLHLGHLLPILCAAHFQRAGHQVLLIVGGATGMVGDPSGRASERSLLTREEVRANTAAIQGQLARFLRFEGEKAAQLLDNHDWIGPLSFIDWLREVGKFFTINYMLQKDSVQSRLESEGGITFTEFSYMTMQAYDFFHLYHQYGCTLQCGGSDQWGNITAGTELIRKKAGGSAFGITYPLIMDANGQKFGKSSGASVWLDAGKTSPYAFYQYFVRTPDADINAWLRYFTFLEIEEIEALMARHQEAPEKRLAQKRLAEELTRTVHGESGLARARKASEVLFGGGIEGLEEAELRQIFADVPSQRLPVEKLVEGMPLLELLLAVKVCPSKNEARRALQQGGIYLNNQRVDDPALIVTSSHCAAGSLLILRSGRKNYTLVEFIA